MHTTTEFQQRDLSGIGLHQPAQRLHSQRMARSIVATLNGVVAFAARLRTEWRRKRQARATYLALARLDSATLRDLGFDRSEIRSVAAEFSPGADSTRVLLRWPDMAARS